MSETSILPGAEAPSTTDGPAVPLPPDFDTAEGGDRRRLMIIGAVVAALVVVVAAFLLLHKGSSGSNQNGLVPHATLKAVPPTAPTGSAPAPKGKGHSSHVLPKTSKRQVVRDPFNPLVVPAAASGSTQSGPTTTVSPPATAPSSAPTAPVVVPTTGSTGPSTSPSSPSTPTTALGRPLWIQLISTSGNRSAVFDVGYKHHKFHRFNVVAPSAHATQGTVFDNVFALLGIQRGVATVQVGDGAPFVLFKGVSHSV